MINNDDGNTNTDTYPLKYIIKEIGHFKKANRIEQATKYQQQEYPVEIQW